MLTESQHTIIRATAPVLRAHGEAISRVFDASLFGAHPELYDIFNPVNQLNGRQQRSLAGSVLNYAVSIERLDRLGGMVERVANKHSSLEVQPAHYPIVGEHLLSAIRTVLGEAATDEIIDAWGAAYGQLAGIMIGREAELYAAEAKTPSGWRGFLPFRLERRVQESSDITSFRLVPEDGRALPPFVPGQYLTVKARLPGYPHDQIRQYSLTHMPNGQYYRIAVRREQPSSGNAPGGLMSGYLLDGLQEGDTLLVHMPLGDLVLADSDRPVVLLSAGSGITPVLAMLDQLTAPAGGARAVVFIHATRSPEAFAFRSEVAAMAARRDRVALVLVLEQGQERNWPGESVSGRISADVLRRHMPVDADIYYCGPPGFIAAVEHALDSLLVPASRRHNERFGPDPSSGNGIDHPRPNATSVR